MADGAAKQRLVDQFAAVAGVDEDRARFYLDMTAWNLDLAMTNFFESNEDSDSEVPVRPRDPTPPRNMEPPRTAGGPTANPPGAASFGPKAPAARPANKSNINSLSTLQANQQSDDSSDEEGQAYFAGGSERSGQQILGPPKKKTDHNKLISSIFSSAREHGAEEEDPSDGASSSGPRVVPFQGTAYRLGDPNTDSTMVSGPPRAQEKRQVGIVLTMWKNGFSLDDGPLRSLTDPANAEFLQSVMRGQLPKELVEQGKGGRVDLSMEDHRDQEYAAPKKVAQSFGGVGRRLGSPTDAVVVPAAAAATASTASSASNALASSSNAAAAAAADAAAQSSIGLNASQPVTDIQIRLADGTRLVAKFNQTHRVSDVRRYIVSARPQFASANFVLMTTFPNRELTDESQTLAAASLLKAVVVQKLK